MMSCTCRLDKTVLLCYELIKHYCIGYNMKKLINLPVPNSYKNDDNSLIALLLQFNAAHDFTMAETNKEQQIFELVFFYVILKFSTKLLLQSKGAVYTSG